MNEKINNFINILSHDIECKRPENIADYQGSLRLLRSFLGILEYCKSDFNKDDSSVEYFMQFIDEQVNDSVKRLGYKIQPDINGNYTICHDGYKSISEECQSQEHQSQERQSQERKSQSTQNFLERILSCILAWLHLSDTPESYLKDINKRKIINNVNDVTRDVEKKLKNSINQDERSILNNIINFIKSSCKKIGIPIEEHKIKTL